MFERLTRWHHSLNGRFFERAAYLREYAAEIERSPGRFRVHLGCGDGTTLARYADVPVWTIALDLDREALARNPGVRRVAGDAMKLPFADASVDLMHCEHVLEHLPDPMGLMLEVSRVLRPGARFVFITPNAWSYVALAARAIPLRVRHVLVECVSGHASTAVHWPTFYRANSVRALRRLVSEGRLDLVRLDGYVSEPCYTAGLPVVHLVAIVWHRFLERARMRRVCGLTLLGVVRKPGG